MFDFSALSVIQKKVSSPVSITFIVLCIFSSLAGMRPDASQCWYICKPDFKGIIMVIVSTILYVDMLRFANTFSAQLNDFIILVINWIFCIFVFIINLAIAIYGFVCGCCYSKEFEKIIQNEQPKSAFSFTTSNKVYFHLVITEKS